MRDDSENTCTLTTNLLQIEPLDKFQPNMAQWDSSYFSSIQMKGHVRGDDNDIAKTHWQNL